jgi:hypothetical protein
VQPVVVDPDVVRELVHDGDADLLDEVVDVLGQQAQRDPVEADPVRQRAGVVLPLGQRDALVQPEQVRLLACSSSTTTTDVVEAGRELGREPSSASAT